MRILQVTHLYPPNHLAGVEVFASTIARLLADAGHEVAVLTTDKDIARPDLALRRREHEGLPVFELTNNLFAHSFDETWRRPAIDEVFRGVLDETRPDVVHVHHLLYLSAGILDVCRERGVPVVMTMHDFWLGCARFGQLLHADGTRCPHIDVERCGTCLPSLSWRQSDVARRVAGGVARIRRATGVDLSGPLRSLRARAVSGNEASFEQPAPDASATFERLAAARRDDLVATVDRCVDRVVLPAAFMRPWYERLGLAPDRIVVETTGVDWDGARRFDRVERGDGEPVRCLFLGSVVPHKGAHVLLDAWERLDPATRDRARLRVLGPDRHRPDYTLGLRARGEPLGVTFGGRLSRDEVRREMARTDLLVTPSLWTEIRPLVMLEAYAAGARNVATDLGGMGEMIRDGVPGRLFPEGDADALRDALEAEIAHALEPRSGPPERREPSPLFRGWPEIARALEGHYRDVCDSSPSAS
ncbi:MAG: glycosyltransferase [Planctomycetota bacterium]